MATDRNERHRYGQHYTPEPVARLLAAFAIRAADDLVFDPACGDGRLLDEALQRKRSLREIAGAQTAGTTAQVFGIDRSSTAVTRSARGLAHIACADFFDIEPGSKIDESFVLPERVDAIVGNPPYIRQEIIGAADKRRIEARIAADTRIASDVIWPEWSRRSDIYVYFFAHSSLFLRTRGRLVFLTASSWLDAGYGGALRRFLLDNFRIVAILESSAESFFSDASIGTAITVLEREPAVRARRTNLVRFVRLTRPLAEALKEGLEPKSSQRAREAAATFARSLEQVDASQNRDAYRIRVVEQASLAAEAASGGARLGWGRYLRADEVFFRIIEKGSARMRPLGELARVRFGVKTGANEFFYVRGAGAEKRSASGKAKGAAGLRALSEVASVRRGITTGANEFFYLKPLRDASTEMGRRGGAARESLLVQDGAGSQRLMEACYLSPVIFSLKEIDGILLDGRRGEKLFFNCAESRLGLAGTSALKYIEAGEKSGYHLRPTCAGREPWYSVARRLKPAPLIFPSKVGERWLVAINRYGVFEDKKLYGVFPGKGVRVLVLAALLNSTWARYYAEVTCRQMTGAQAIADIDVVAAQGIMLPNPGAIEPAVGKALEAAVGSLARRPVRSVFEEVKRVDRRRLDRLVLTAMGFTNRAEREQVLDQLYAAVTKLVRSRLDKRATLVSPG